MYCWHSHQPIRRFVDNHINEPDILLTILSTNQLLADTQMNQSANKLPADNHTNLNQSANKLSADNLINQSDISWQSHQPIIKQLPQPPVLQQTVMVWNISVMISE